MMFLCLDEVKMSNFRGGGGGGGGGGGVWGVGWGGGCVGGEELKILECN